MRRRRQPLLVGLAVGLAGASWSAVTLAAEPEPAACALQSYVAPWRVEALLGDAAGTAAWVRCPDGAWRLDVALAAPDDPDTGTAAAALGRLGEGWTAVAPGDGSVVMQAWDGPLRTLEPAQADRLTVLLALAVNGGDPTRAAVAPAVWRQRAGDRDLGRRVPWETRAPAAAPLLLVWPADDDGAAPLAHDLACRGLGRGGAGEGWRVGAGPDGGARLEASRLAATLELGPPQGAVRWGDPLEVVLPLWPLGEVLAESDDR